jgi:hypothetical protein
MTSTINLEPNWAGMFRYAARIAKSEIPEDKGQEVVVQMLQYGERLYNLSGDGGAE